MIVYCVMEKDFIKNETELKMVFRDQKKAMDFAEICANEKVKGYSQTRDVVRWKDGFMAVWSEENDIETVLNDENTVAAYYVKEMLVNN